MAHCNCPVCEISQFIIYSISDGPLDGFHFLTITKSQGFHGSSVVKESTPAQETGVWAMVGKIPQAEEQLSPYATAIELIF